MAKKTKKGKSAKPVPPKTAPGPAKAVNKPGFSLEQTPWVPYAVFILLTLILFGNFITSNNMFFGTDTIPSEFMKRTIYAEYVKEHHEIPRWNPYTLGGLPFIDAMHGDIFYPTTVLKFFLPVHRALGWKLILHVILAGIFMFLCLKRMGVNRHASFIGALMYMYCPNLVSFFYGGHDGKIFVIALFPLMFLALYHALDTKKLFHFALFGGAVGLSLLTSHIQMTYFALFGLGFYFAYRLIDEYVATRDIGSSLRTLGLFCIGIGLGLGIGMMQLLPPLLYVREFSVRAGKTGYEHATSWCLHPEEMVSLLVPEFIHFLDTYWGQNPFRLNYTGVGMVVILFACVRLLVKQGKREWFYLGFSLFFLLFAMGRYTPIHRLAYYLVPGIKLMRGPEMSMFLFGFWAIVLAALGLHSVITDPPEDQKKFLRILLIILGSYALLALIVEFTGAGRVLNGWQKLFYPDIAPDKLRALEANAPAFRKGMWLSLIILGAGIGLIYGLLNRKLKPLAVTVLLGIIVVFELWRINSRFVKVVNPSQYIARDPVIAQLQNQKEKFRVYPINQSYRPNYLGIFGIESILGFHDNEIKWYREFRDSEANFLYKLRQHRTNTHNNPFLNLLNMKYYLFRDPQTQKVQIIENKGALPRVFFASGYEVIKDQESIFARLKDPGFDYRRTVILEEDPGVTVRPDSGIIGTHQVKAYTARNIELVVDMQQAGFLVLSENYFPYWKATIDGKETKVYKTDYVLRSVPVPSGRHTVRFTYSSPPFRTGRLLTLISLVVLLVPSVIVFRRWNRETQALARLKAFLGRKPGTAG